MQGAVAGQGQRERRRRWVVRDVRGRRLSLGGSAAPAAAVNERRIHQGSHRERKASAHTQTQAQQPLASNTARV